MENGDWAVSAVGEGMSETKIIIVSIRDEKVAHLLEAVVRLINASDGKLMSHEQNAALEQLNAAVLEFDEKGES